MARASLIPQILDALVAGLRSYSTTEVTFRAPTSIGEGTAVYDGPEWRAYEGPDLDGWLVIGWGGEPVDERPALGERGDVVMGGGSEVRAIATSSPKAQPEDGISCVAVYSGGDIDTAGARSKAWQIVDAVDSYLRADPKVGIAPSADGQVLWVQVTARSMEQWLNAGSWCSITFTLTASTRT